MRVRSVRKGGTALLLLFTFSCSLSPGSSVIHHHLTEHKTHDCGAQQCWNVFSRSSFQIDKCSLGIYQLFSALTAFLAPFVLTVVMRWESTCLTVQKPRAGNPRMKSGCIPLFRCGGTWFWKIWSYYAFVIWHHKHPAAAPDPELSCPVERQGQRDMLYFSSFLP